jgi:hypothetical protein
MADKRDTLGWVLLGVVCVGLLGGVVALVLLLIANSNVRPPPPSPPPEVDTRMITR